MRKLLTASLLVMLAACGPDDVQIRNTLQAEGYTNITLGDRAWNRCGHDHGRVFEAEKGDNGVVGAVCYTGTKNMTIRIESTTPRQIDGIEAAVRKIEAQRRQSLADSVRQGLLH